MPGEDARETARTVTGEVGDFPFLPELPGRGPGADMVGRSVGMLVDVYAHLQPSGWRTADRPGMDTRRARSWLGEDLDALEEFTQGYAAGRSIPCGTRVARRGRPRPVPGTGGHPGGAME